MKLVREGGDDRDEDKGGQYDEEDEEGASPFPGYLLVPVEILKDLSLVRTFVGLLIPFVPLQFQSILFCHLEDCQSGRGSLRCQVGLLASRQRCALKPGPLPRLDVAGLEAA